ncbi:MAG: sensor histidine kinase [Aestuariibaculum sp.]
MESATGETIVIAILLIMSVGFFMVLMFFIFNKRKNLLIKEKAEVRERLENEMIKSQMEIREQTLRNISWELHDNIGQLLTLAKIQLQSVQQSPDKLAEATNILGSALDELRALSKSINPESLKSRNLIEALQLEANRFNRLNYIKSYFEVNGTPFKIPEKDETILFRILQEFFSNTIRHAKATQLQICLNFDTLKLILTAKDNGIGFSGDKFDGIGLKNMKKRAELIGANLNIESVVNQGTQLDIVYHKNPKY